MIDIEIFSESFVLLDNTFEIVHFALSEEELLNTTKGCLKPGKYFIYQVFNTSKGDVLESTNRFIVVL